MNKKIAVIKGDGIGPEVVTEALKVLAKIALKYHHEFEFTEVLAGGCAIDKYDECLPKETVEVCKASDAVILGAVGGYKWDNVATDKRPEKALLGLRKELGLYANLRPVIMFDELIDRCLLKAEIVKGGLDILIVRELISGIYFGEHVREKDYAYDKMFYSRNEIERIVKKGFEAAMGRNKKLIVVDKANVLETSRLWREIANEIHLEYQAVELDFMYVDNAAMQLVKNPKQFDVIVTSNMFGDILSDEASMITGSIGLLPSASINDTNFGMYEPIHGSAPDIANQNIANPIATILSIALMFRYTFKLEDEAKAIENACRAVLAEGYRTIDLSTDGNYVSCSKMGDLISAKI